MCVFVKDAAEPVSSAYAQVDNPLGIRDRIRDGALRSRLAQRLVSSVPVAEQFVLAKSVPQVVFVPQEAAIEEFTTARLHPPLHDGIQAKKHD